MSTWIIKPCAECRCIGWKVNERNNCATRRATINICVCAASREVFYLRHSGPHSRDLTFAPAPPKPTNQQKHEFWPKSKLAGVELAKVEQAVVEQIRMAKVERFAIHLGVPDLICASNHELLLGRKTLRSFEEPSNRTRFLWPSETSPSTAAMHRSLGPAPSTSQQLRFIHTVSFRIIPQRETSSCPAQSASPLLSRPWCSPFVHILKIVIVSVFTFAAPPKKSEVTLPCVPEPVVPQINCRGRPLESPYGEVSDEVNTRGIHVHLRRFFKQLFSIRPDRCQWPDLIFVESQCAHCAHWRLLKSVGSTPEKKSVSNGISNWAFWIAPSIMSWKVVVLGSFFGRVLLLCVSELDWMAIAIFLYASPWEWAIADVGGYSKAVLPRCCLWC